MAINIKSSTLAAREERLGSVTGYVGDLHDIVEQSRNGQLKGKNRCYSQASACLAGCAISQISGIRDVLVINHAPAGCTALAPVLEDNGRLLAEKRGVTTNTVLVGTDLNENDTVFGAGESLKETTLISYERYNPKAIFITTSCVSGIIGEDIDSIIEEIQKEVPVPVVAAHCEGFKSHIWGSGFEIADHAVLRAIVKPPKQKRNVINFKNFCEGQRKEIIEIFAKFGVEPLFLYRNSTIEELSRLSESLATVSICGSLSTYLGNGLEQEYGVPYVNTLSPSGIIGFETWLREIGKVIDKNEEVESYIKEQREIYITKIEEIKKKLKGLRVVIAMGPGFGFEAARVAQELGLEIVWHASWHYDQRHDNGELPVAVEYLEKNTPGSYDLSVTELQNHEILNILNEYKPDLYLCRHPGSTVWAIKQGVPSICVVDEYMMFGYKNTLSFAQTILNTVTNRSFEKNLAARVKLPYTKWWFEQNNYKFIEGVER